MKKETKEKLQTMKEDDIYSLILFALFKIKGIPEYSSISELSYILDSKSLFNLLEYYGGTTIRIPTLDEFKVVIQGLLMYQFINVEGIEYTQAVKLLKEEHVNINEVKECYAKLVEILKDYSFNIN